MNLLPQRSLCSNNKKQQNTTLKQHKYIVPNNLCHRKILVNGSGNREDGLVEQDV